MKGNSFQTIVLVIFGVLGVLAVLIFSGAIPIGKKSSQSTAQGSVTLWGTFKRDQVIQIFEEFNRVNKTYIVNYIEKNPVTLETDLVEAIASGVGPDVVIISQEQILSLQNKLYHIAYQSFPERTYRDTYVTESGLYLLPDGIVALPLTIDPMIMYYNKNLFEAAGITQAPKTWDDVSDDVKLLTKKDERGNVIQSGIALGTFTNINNAKDILATLIMQTGNPIAVFDGKTARSTLVDKPKVESAPSTSTALDFYNQFSNPLSNLYSWTKSHPNSRDAFLGEKLAIYLGYASELPLISAKNPNLNFDIARFPQVKDSTSLVTFGNMYGVAIVKSTKNFNTAFTAASAISGQDFEQKLVKALLEKAPIAPARRDLLATPPANLYGPVLYNSALIARGWLDLGDSVTNPIFSDMIEDVVKGVSNTSESIYKASNRYNLAAQ